MKSPKPSEYIAIDVSFLRPSEDSVKTRAPHYWSNTLGFGISLGYYGGDIFRDLEKRHLLSYNDFWNYYISSTTL